MAQRVESGRTDIHDNDRNGETVKSREHVEVARVGKLILETDKKKARFVLEFKLSKEMFREFVNERKRSMSTAKERLFSY
jgi:hypothetical protein